MAIFVYSEAVHACWTTCDEILVVRFSWIVADVVLSATGFAICTVRLQPKQLIAICTRGSDVSYRWPDPVARFSYRSCTWASNSRMIKQLVWFAELVTIHLAMQNLSPLVSMVDCLVIALSRTVGRRYAALSITTRLHLLMYLTNWTRRNAEMRRGGVTPISGGLPASSPQRQLVSPWKTARSTSN